MKRAGKWTSITLLVCVGIFSLLWIYSRLRRQAITGDWTEPTIEFCAVHHSVNSDQSASLIHYFYTVSQTAKLKYPHYVWKDTAWERLIKERHNSIAKGYGVSIVTNGKVHTFPVDSPIDQVLWSDSMALCKTEDGWISIDGAKCESLPPSFIPPQGVTNALSERERMLPTSADKHPEISKFIRDNNLGALDGRNFYKPKRN